jgi:hypothetical protein
MFDVSGKRAIITGGAQGFGLQVTASGLFWLGPVPWQWRKKNKK